MKKIRTDRKDEILLKINSIKNFLFWNSGIYAKQSEGYKKAVELEEYLKKRLEDVKD